MKFSSFNLKVPSNWVQPTGDALAMFNKAFKPSERVTTPGMPPLFQPASLNKYHTDAQKMHIAKIGEFIDKMCDAICDAWGKWHESASMAGVVINALTATGGQLVGPPLAPLIMAKAPKGTPMQLKYSSAIANVIGAAWLAYTSSIKIPGLPMFPAFAMCPTPMAPPTANVPFPLMALTQIKVPIMMTAMKPLMIAGLADPLAPFHKEMFESFCVAFETMFAVYEKTTMVTNLIGTGAVPTFAPPVVPAGPVVGGVATMAPGGLK